MVALARRWWNHTILKNIGALFSGTAVARVFSALGLFIIARQLGPDEFGVFVSTLSLAKLTSVLFSLGLDTWLLRNGRNHPERPLAVASSVCLGIKLSLGAAWFVGLLLISPFLKQAIFPRDVLILAALSIWLDELASTGWSTFKTALRNTITVWLIIGAQGLFFIAILLLAGNDVTVTRPYMAARALTSAVSGGMALWLVARLVGIHWRRALMPFVLRDTAPFGLSEGLAVIYERADITIIGHWLGKTAAGLYAPAVSLTTTLFLIPQAIYEVMLPVTSEMFVRTPQRIRRQAFRIILLSAFLGAALGLGMVLIARPIVWLIYGPAYTLSGDILTILSTILVFKSVSFGSAAVLTAVGWQNRRVMVQAVAAALNIGLNLALVQVYGLWGVAYIYVLTEAVLMVGYILFYLRWQSTYKIEEPVVGAIYDQAHLPPVQGSQE